VAGIIPRDPNANDIVEEKLGGKRTNIQPMEAQFGKDKINSEIIKKMKYFKIQGSQDFLNHFSSFRILKLIASSPSFLRAVNSLGITSFPIYDYSLLDGELN
jgi:hypothetical protein